MIVNISLKYKKNLPKQVLSLKTKSSVWIRVKTKQKCFVIN